MTSTELEKARGLLCRLQDAIQERLIAARNKKSTTFSRIAAVTKADTIYEVDKISEEAIFEWFEENWPRRWPVQLVMEGVEDDAPVAFPRGTPIEETRFKCILDPIDGTRNLMYDKRPAWILTGLAPQRGPRTNLQDIVVAVMTELPTTKQWRADQVSAIRGAGLRATAKDLRTGRRAAMRFTPSRARDFEHGFASLVHFFPEGKALLSGVEEALWTELGLNGKNAGALVFDDQYLTTGGQIYEILVGHDRMLGDLRPLAFAKLGLNSALTCHPYDICTALILEEAGGVVESPEGKPLNAFLDTTSPVAWMGYANPVLAKQVRPILRRLVKRWF
jgi:fructose-1,6-bisphosphatase/inositol monophosphatase family enzyme